MIILFQNILLLKEFLGCNGCFGLFTKIIKRSGNISCCIFSAWFFHKNAFYLILHLWTKFQCHTFFPSQDIKQDVLLSSYLDNWWRHKLLRFIFDHPLKQWPTGRKRGKDRNRKIWLSQEWKELFYEIKRIFHSFWRVIIWWKNKNLIKIADTSFNCNH